jgi:hypothetical protein
LPDSLSVTAVIASNPVLGITSREDILTPGNKRIIFGVLKLGSKMRTLSNVVVLSCAVAFSVAQTRSAPRLALDATKPIVYVSLDRIGPRPPVDEYEPDRGLWLRVVNNCTLPIEVQTMEAGTEPELTLVADEIIGRMTTILKSHRSEEQPMGYSAFNGSPEIIGPGKSLLFSVPVNHVAKSWYVRIPFRFELPPTTLY